MHAHIGVVDVRNLRRVDRVLVLLAVVLAGIGLITLYSAGHGQAGSTSNFEKQGVWFILGAIVAAAIVCTDYRFLVSLAPVIYGVAIGLLVLVLFFGVEARGGKSWLGIGPLRYQPSELSKIAVVYMLAWYLSTIGKRVAKLPYFLLAFVITGLPCVLIRLQNDTGTALTLLPLPFVMLYAAGCKRWHLAAIILIGLVAAPILWRQIDEDNYQKKRIRTFLNPELDPKGQELGWQPRQTKITVGSGQIKGKGFLKGTQTHLRWLPEHHTDFIFALLAEEQGFVGAAGLLALFAAFFLRALKLGRDSDELSGTLLAVGVVTVLGFHAFVNVAVTLALLPVMGIPLPFLSYGGSFCLTTMACVGVLLSVPLRKGYFAK